MKPSRTLAGLLSSLLAADTSSIAHGTNAVKVGVVTENINPTLDSVIGDFTVATADGLAALSGVVGAQLESVDPVTGELIVEIKPPAGGFRFELTGVTGAPYTVYGFVLMNSAASAWYGFEKLETPITLTAVNEAITAPALKFRIDPTKIT